MRASVLTSAEYQKTSCSNHAAPTLDLVETRMASCQESSAAPDSWRPHSVDTDSSQSSPQQNARPRHISEMRQDTEVQVQDPASWRLYLAQMLTLWHSWLPSEAGRHPSPCKKRRSVSSIRREAIISRTTCENIRELFQVQMRHKR